MPRASRRSAKRPRRRGVHAGILLDLQGPKIRLGSSKTAAATLPEGRAVRHHHGNR